MVYFDVRPANSVPTLELRVCDSCPSVDTVLLIAGIFRALVERELEAAEKGIAPTILSPAVGQPALWRAARSGLKGELVDVRGPVSRPASEVVSGLVDALRPQLEHNGDWDTVSELSRQALILGTSSARQRRALRGRGRLTDVVDQLIVETASRQRSTQDIPVAIRDDPSLLFGYHLGSKPISSAARADLDDGYDEAVDADGKPRQAYKTVLDAIARLGVAQLRSREADIEQEQRADELSPSGSPVKAAPSCSRSIWCRAW